MRLLKHVSILHEPDGYAYISLRHLCPIIMARPNLIAHYPDAQRYKGLRHLNLKEWIRIASTGHSLKWSQITTPVAKVRWNREKFRKKHIRQFKQDLYRFTMEMPILGKFSTGRYTMICGNVTLVEMIARGYNPTVWVIDIPTWRTKDRMLKGVL